MIHISLIIATYNRSRQLVTALRSVAMQDLPFSEWECIVVNNASTDDTEAVFAEFAVAHPLTPLRMVYEAEPGLSAARNRGIAEATGRLVAFIDDDEWIEPQFLRSYIEFFACHPHAVAAGGPIVAEYPDGRPAWLSKYPERALANVMDYGPRVRRFPSGKIPGGGNMALLRMAFTSVGDFNVRFGRVGTALSCGEESELFERMRRMGIEPWYVPGAVMHHVIPAAKLTESYFRRLCRNVGANQQQRARMQGRLLRARLTELLKWGAALLLCCTLRPVQARWLLIMRREIAGGLFSRLP